MNQVVGKGGSITLGEYPIFEWAVPISRLRDTGIILGKNDYQVAFTGKDYVLNEEVQGIRRSDELDLFYKNEYVKKNAYRYKHFEGFETFDFNYNFEIIDYNRKGERRLEVMKGSTVVVPSYITAIY